MPNERYVASPDRGRENVCHWPRRADDIKVRGINEMDQLKQRSPHILSKTKVRLVVEKTETD